MKENDTAADLFRPWANLFAGLPHVGQFTVAISLSNTIIPRPQSISRYLLQIVPRYAKIVL